MNPSWRAKNINVDPVQTMVRDTEIRTKADVTGGKTEEASDEGDAKRKLMKLVQLEQNLRNMSDELDSSSLESILDEVKNDISDIINAKRITIYMVDHDADELCSRVFDGDEVQEIRKDLTRDSVAGFVACESESVVIDNVYDDEELEEVHEDLQFDASWDQRTGFTTRQMLAVPLKRNDTLYGVLQALNKENDPAFTRGDLRMVKDLCSTLSLALAIRERIQSKKSHWDYLLKNNVIDPEELDRAREISDDREVSVEKVLMDEFGVTREQMGDNLEDYYRYPYVAYDPDQPIPVGLIQELDREILEKNLWVPLEEEDGRARVLMANPKDVQTRDDIEAWYGGPINYAVGIREEVLAYIEFFFEGDDEDGTASDEQDGGGDDVDTRIFNNSIDDLLEEAAEDRLTESLADDEDDGDDGQEVSENDSAIVKLVNQIIVKGFKQGASDIHIETNPDNVVKVRFRVDGVCKVYRTLPRHFAPALVSRIKIMSKLDIAQRRLPQDGKIKFRNFGPLDLELRVATMPTQGDVEDVVLRILSGTNFFTINDIGMRPEVEDQFRELLRNPHGIILCVGPTGSGKTTTLHAALHHLNEPDVKICTAEDPVEITQEGLRQLEVSPKIDLTFPRAMKAFLRCDPDVIMVGEMRDLETTSTAIEASLTGHLVFSTLHTNSAPETVSRLLELDIDPFTFGDALRGVLAQRLVRTFCDECRREIEDPARMRDELRSEFGDDELFEEYAPDPRDMQLLEAPGCDACNNGGYSGRMAIHELLVSSDEVKRHIYDQSRASKLQDTAKEQGMLTLKQDGILKVLQGKTDLSEVQRVCIG